MTIPWELLRRPVTIIQSDKVGGCIPSREVGRTEPKALRSFHVVRFISTNAAEYVQGHREEKSVSVCVSAQTLPPAGIVQGA